MPTRPNAGKPTPTKGGAAKGGKTVKTTTAKPKSVTKADAATSAAAVAKVEPVVVTTLVLKEIVKVVLKDPDQKIRKARKPVLLIDNESENASSFLRYTQDATFNPDIKFQKPENVRLGILGSCRANRPYVVYLEDTDTVEQFKTVTELFDKVATEVTDGVMASCMDMSITKWEKLQHLEKPSDVDPMSPSQQYSEEADRANFYLVILTAKKDHPEDFKAKFTVFAVED